MTDRGTAPRRRGFGHDLRAGLVAMGTGAVMVLVVQLAQPVRAPLYDGVVVQEPYRFLRPTGDQAGSPTTFTSMPSVDGTESPLFAAATTESPPQAQLIAQKGAFELTPGATALVVSINPVEPPETAPLDGAISGNVYRFSVTDQAGTPLSIAPCEGCVSMALRAPDDAEEPRLVRFAAGLWVEVETTHTALGGAYATNPTVLGDYAVLSAVVPGGGGDTALTIVYVAGAIAIALLVAFIWFVTTRTRRAQPAGGPGTGRAAGSTTSRRSRTSKQPRKRPSGRSDR